MSTCKFAYRSAVARMKRISLRILEDPNKWTIGRIAVEEEVSEKTVARDVEFLRSAFGHQLAFQYVHNRQGGGWYYLTPPKGVL